MISIIVCSIDVDNYNALINNIALTIGTEFEVIKIDNFEEKYSLTQAYNLGASKAKFDCLVFIHEDILFRTNNWGTIIIQSLKIERIGLIGVAGSNFKSSVPSSWYEIEKYRYVNIVQHYKFANKESKHIIFGFQQNENYKEAVIIDGVFMATKKAIWLQIKFDEKLPGFHGYDIDFSLAISKKYKVLITSKILLEHFSEGRENSDWLYSTIKVARKWHSLLPLSTLEISNIPDKLYFESTMNNFILKMKWNGFTRIQRLFFVIYFSGLSKLNFKFLKRAI